MSVECWSCPCEACGQFRAAKSQPRMVLYFDRMRPAWHVPGTPEWLVYHEALVAVCYSHPHESAMGVALPARWDALMRQS